MATVTEYRYSLSADFGNGLTPGKLVSEIQDDDGISRAVDRVEVNGDIVSIWFRDALEQAEVIELDAVVAAHVEDPDWGQQEVVVKVDESSNRIISGRYDFDHDNGGALVLPRVSELPADGVGGEVVLKTDTGAVYRFDGQSWNRVVANPSAHGASHEKGGEDEISHDSLAGAGVYTHVELDVHVEADNNPHGVTKQQVGLGNVLDGAQVLRDPDFSTFPAVASLQDTDLFLVEAGASHEKAHVPFSVLMESVPELPWHGYAESLRRTLAYGVRWVTKVSLRFSVDSEVTCRVDVSYNWGAFNFRGNDKKKKATFQGRVVVDGDVVAEHIEQPQRANYVDTRQWFSWFGQFDLDAGDHEIVIMFRGGRENEVAVLSDCRVAAMEVA